MNDKEIKTTAENARGARARMIEIGVHAFLALAGCWLCLNAVPYSGEIGLWVKNVFGMGNIRGTGFSLITGVGLGLMFAVVNCALKNRLTIMERALLGLALCLMVAVARVGDRATAEHAELKALDYVMTYHGDNVKK